MSSPRTIQTTLVEQEQERHLDLSKILYSPKIRKTPTLLSQINNNEIEKLKDVVEIEKAVLENERKGLDNENKWTSCCITMDKRAVLFFSQLSISVSIMGLCIYQLITHYDDCDNNQLYSGILTMLIGIHLPAPKLRK